MDFVGASFGWVPVEAKVLRGQGIPNMSLFISDVCINSKESSYKDLLRGSCRVEQCQV